MEQSDVILHMIKFLIAVIQWRNSTRFYGANGMCFPLHLDDPFFAGWQFSAFIFIGINLCWWVLLADLPPLPLIKITFILSFSLLIIGVLYTGMFWSIWRTRHATTLNVREFEFAFRFFFIVLTTTACWAPIIILKLLAFFRTYISGYYFDIHIVAARIFYDFNSLSLIVFPAFCPLIKCSLRRVETWSRKDSIPSRSERT